MNSDMHVAGHLTALGWTTFSLYLVAALFSFRAAASDRTPGSAALGNLRIWLGAVLLLLGLNKPVDLQTLLIKLGRRVADKEHLWMYRLEFYALFFWGFVLFVSLLFAAMSICKPGRISLLARQLPLATGGCVLLCVYIVIRAASITHVDFMLGLDLKHIPFLWLLEAVGLMLIIFQALGDKHRHTP